MPICEIGGKAEGGAEASIAPAPTDHSTGGALPTDPEFIVSAGYFGSAGASVATGTAECPAGYFSDLQGSGSVADCQVCPPGHFSDPGAVRCEPCPTGTFNSYSAGAGVGVERDSAAASELHNDHTETMG